MARNYSFDQKLFTVRNDPSDKFNFSTGKPPRQRQKKTVGEGKEFKLNGPANTKRTAGENAEAQAQLAKRHAAAKKIGKLFSGLTDEQRKKAANLAKKRRNQEAKDKTNGIYRENHLTPELYENWMNQAYGSNKNQENEQKRKEKW